MTLAPKPSETQPSTTVPVVLLIDDHLETRASASELLADLGYQPVVARNGLEGLQLLRRGLAPAALLIDLYMPLMDADSFCDALNEEPALTAIPRIIVSADHGAGTAWRLSRCRARGFLRKPLDLSELETLLEQVLRSVDET